MVCSSIDPAATACIVDEAAFLGDHPGSSLHLHRGAGGSAWLRKSDIRAAIASHHDEVRRCYDDALAVWPDAKGRVEITFVVGPDGSVYSSRVDRNDTGVPALACCINELVATWKFPALVGCGMVVVTNPFVLELGSS